MAVVLQITRLTDVFMLLGELWEIYANEGIDYEPRLCVTPNGDCTLYMEDGVTPGVSNLREAKAALEARIADLLRQRRLRVVREFTVAVKLERDGQDGAEGEPAFEEPVKRKLRRVK